MNKIKNYYKETFNQINVSDEQKKRILDKVVFPRRKKKFKLALTVCSLLLICLVGTSLVYAKEIISTIQSFIVSKSKAVNGDDMTEWKKEGLAEINYDAKIEPPEGDKVYSTDELSELLGIKLLKNKNFYKDELKTFKLSMNEDKIAGASFWMKDCVQFDGSSGFVNFSLSFVTKYSNKEGNSYATTIEKNEIYHIKSLNTDAIISHINDRNPKDIYNKGALYRHAAFVYNNVFYSIDYLKTNYQEQDLYDFLEAFETD